MRATFWLWCVGFSFCWLHLLQPTGSRAHVVVASGVVACGSVVVDHGLSSSGAIGFFPDQGSNPSLHWQAVSLPLSHLGNPVTEFTNKCLLLPLHMTVLCRQNVSTNTICKNLLHFLFCAFLWLFICSSPKIAILNCLMDFVSWKCQCPYVMNMPICRCISGISVEVVKTVQCWLIWFGLFTLLPSIILYFDFYWLSLRFWSWLNRGCLRKIF